MEVTRTTRRQNLGNQISCGEHYFGHNDNDQVSKKTEIK